MKSKLHIRVETGSHTTEAEVEITGQRVTGVTILKQGNPYYELPKVNSYVKAYAKAEKKIIPRTLAEFRAEGKLKQAPSLEGWCCKGPNHHQRQVKLPNEPESAYRYIENLMQLGDIIGCGQVD